MHQAIDDDLQALARRRVGAKLGFLTHLAVFCLVNLGLYVLNFWQGGEHWHWFPLAGWGLGLTIHGLVTLFVLGGQGLRQRMLAQELERLRRG